jgi:hypothetical protein
LAAIRLAEVGLPQHSIAVALLFFNVGVEFGQLIFVAAVLSLISLLRYVASNHGNLGAYTHPLPGSM